ncbi:hypothetical protein AJ79_09901 [Helicocarpus griseus UAMH5409]|uniref:N-acetyltransferase domain-containing protein n=1 Tax=Helicocarpus griseus UAMH5409 TaxID=1447875 RepID=A0A2B7WGJ6_9EURO|nr:hypothetical protein AJ79_09901 [Helicocarpus griseus UAMH5409]
MAQLEQTQSQCESDPPHSPVQQWIRSFPSLSLSPSFPCPTKTSIPSDNDPATNGMIEYLISTDPSLLSLSAINAAFAQEYMYWAKPLPEPLLQEMLDRSLCFGVYTCNNNGADTNITTNSATTSTSTDSNSTSQKPFAKNPTQIGFARIVTDNVTIAYLTDVYILPEYQGIGLGSWMLQCVNEWVDGRDESGYFRRLMLLTVGGHRAEYYRRVIGAEQQGRVGEVYVLGRKGKGGLV